MKGNTSTEKILKMIKTHKITPEEGMKLYNELQQKFQAPIEGHPTDSSDVNGKAKLEGEENPQLKAKTLKDKTEAYLKQILAQEIKLPVSRIKSNEPLEKYGIDSVLVINLNRRLENHFGELSKTLLFEYQNISDLAEYFIKNHSLTEKIVGVVKPQAARKETKEEKIKLANVRRSRFMGRADLSKRDDGIKKEDIAIIGVSGRYPMANNLEEFWKNLKEGKDCISEIPASRWDYRQYYDPDKTKTGKVYFKWGGFLDDVDRFDPLFFNISPREAEFMDPQERLFLETVWQTIEDAGYSKTGIQKFAVGVFVGIMYGQYQMFGVEESLKGNVMALGSSYASIANRISYYFNFQGPSMAIDSMCSSSLTTTHLACESIRRGECEVAISGGVNVTIHPNKYVLLSQGKFASSDGRCRSFGEGGDGYVPGEGAGAVLLKPLSRAVLEGDHIYAVIKGSSLNHGGKTNSYTVPNPIAQGKVIREALIRAKVDPGTISYLEAHGTGTALGDPIEITGLIKAFKGHNRENQYCSIGSVKSNVGHLESAAGIAGITKVLLQIKHKKLVPSIHSGKLNPNINFEDSPFKVQHELEEWEQPVIEIKGEKKRYLRRAGVSSFGAGGSNAHIILEEYESSEKVMESQESQIIVLSARNEDRLKVYAGNMVRFLEKVIASQKHDSSADEKDDIKEPVSNVYLSQIAYTLQTGREAMEERLALVVSSTEELYEKLHQFYHGKVDIENFYQGNVKTGQNRSELLVDGRAGEEFIRIIIDDKELDKLARLWVAGVEIDWKLLYPEKKSNRISLPTYPFDREPYWAPISDREIKIGHSQSLRLHPLIDTNESTLNEQCFKKILSEDEFFLRDHLLDKKMLLPGAAYLEMAKTAGDLANRKDRVKRIKNIVWASPITLMGSPQEVYIGLYPNGKGVDFEVSQGASPATEGVSIHAQGKIEYEDHIINNQSKTEFIDISSVKKQCLDSISGKECYQRFEEVGLKYGPAFQSIQELHRGKTEALSHLKLPEILKAEFQDFILHPTLIDGAFQTVAGVLGNKEAESQMRYLPYALGEVDIVKPLPETCYAYAMLSENNSKDISGIKKFKILIVDEEGQVLLRMNDFLLKELRQIPKATMGTGINASKSDEVIYLESVWKKSDLAFKTIDKKPLGNVLIFDSDEIMLDALKERTEDGITQVILVKPGKRYQNLGNNRYEINPVQQKDYQQLISTLKQQNSAPDKIIHMWSEDTVSGSGNSLKTKLEKGIYSLFYLSKAFLEQKIKNKIYLLYIYSAYRDEMHPEYAAVGGFVRSIRMENPNFAYKTIERGEPSEKSQLLDVMFKELITETGDEIEIRYEDNQRFVKQLKEFEMKSDAGSVPLKEKGVYLITGGAGGLGSVFAEYLARKVKARLVLTGRSDLSAEREARIKKLESLGSEVIYIKADVSIRADVNKLIKQARFRFKRIDGIIHSAGVIKDAFLLKKTKKEMDSVLVAKVYGTFNLDDVTKDEKLDFFVLFSSAAAVIGNMGQSDYAFGNSFMDNMALMRTNKKRSGRSLSINWPLWKEGGMMVNKETMAMMKEMMGLTPLNTQKGIKAFEDGLKYNIPQLIVFEGEKDKIKNTLRLPQPQSAPSLEIKPDGKKDELEAGLAMGTAPALAGVSLSLLKQKAEDYLKNILSKEIKLPAIKIHSQDSFERYGIDSVMIMNMIRDLEANFGELSKTLFFEYQNIDELADYFIKNHKEKVIEKVGGFSEHGEGETKPELREEKKPASLKRTRFLIAPDALSDKYETLQEADLRSKALAIIGLRGRYPMAQNVEEFWENLKIGKDCITEIPQERWDYHSYFDPDKDKLGKTYSKWGGFISDADKFDPLFFNIAPREAEFIDPQERIFLETVWQTIEDAGYTRASLRKDKVGVFVGVMWGQYQLLQAEIEGSIISPVSSYASIANRVSYFFNFNGPSIALDTMCSSSLTAIHLACESILRGESTVAIAGGVNLSIHPNKYILLSQQRFVSTDGRCRSFGEGGDGYVPGEGVGAVLLKSLERAKFDGDQIYAVIKGSEVNHGGRTHGYSVPNPNAQASLISETLKKSKIDPQMISYLEAHGTGTSLGDPVEITGLMKAFKEYTSERQYCSIGSVKSNIGHLESAAGIAGLTKVLLQMKYKKLVPSIHSEKLNPNINFKDSPFRVQHKLEDWKQPVIIKDGEEKKYPRLAGISSFGAGGSNAHILLEEYKKPEIKQGEKNHKQHLIVISAKNDEILTRYVKDIASFLLKAISPNEYHPQDTSSHDDHIYESGLIQNIHKDLLKFVAEILMVNETEASLIEDMNEFRFDMIGASKFINLINEKYDLDIPVTLFSEFSSLKLFVRYLFEEYKDIFILYYQKSFKESLKREIEDKQEDYKKKTQGNNISLESIAYTLQIGREAMEERLALIVSSINELIEKLTQYCDGNRDIENIYRANVKGGRDRSELLVEGEEGEEFVSRLIANRKISKLGLLWVSGFEIDWKLLYSEHTPTRISLPTYPFMKERCWISEVNSDNHMSNDQTRTPKLHNLIDRNTLSIKEQKYTTPTKHCLLKKSFKESRDSNKDIQKLSGSIIVLVNNESKAIAGKLFKNIDTVKAITIQNKSSYDKQSDSDYSIDFQRADHGVQIAGEILKKEGKITEFVDLSDLWSKPADECKGSIGKIVLLQELIKNLNYDSFSVLHFTKGLSTFRTDQPTIAGADFAGFVKMLSAEYRKVRSRTIDLDVSLEDLYKIREIIFRELGSQVVESEACYRNGKRYIPFIEEIFSQNIDQLRDFSESISIDPNRAIVITGGTRGIGAEVAKHLADRGARKLVLMGIKELPPRNRWQSLINDKKENQGTIDKIKKVIALEKQGISVELYTGSLINRTKLDEFFNKIREKQGDIEGVIHCAGLSIVENPAFINKKSEDIKRVFEPKMDGLQILHKAFSKDKLNFFVLFSSVSSLIPMLAVGNSDYAAANTFMDYFAAYQFSKGNEYYRSIHWPSWREVGMGEIKSPIYRQLGLTSHTTANGLLMFDHLMKLKQNVCVTPCLVEGETFNPARLLNVEHEWKLPAKTVPIEKHYKKAAPLGEKVFIKTKAWLKELFSKELKIPLEKLGEETPFGDFGVDSILLAELVKKVEERVGYKLDPSVFMEYPTLNQLSQYLDKSVAEEPGTTTAFTEASLLPKMLSDDSTFEQADISTPQKIAVIGVACHFPGAQDKESFWKNLAAGKSSIVEVPRTRWDISRFYAPDYQKGKSISKWGGFLEDIEYFDPDYFKINEKDAIYIDPLIRQFLEVSVQTLRDAGYEKDELWNSKTGVFVGARMGDFASQIKHLSKSSIIGIGQNFISAHISHFFNFKGPNMVVDSACSSSLLSIHLACQSLMLKESDLALAGGVDILLNEKPYLLFSEGRALSPDGKCHTFDEKANGFVPGEGCGAVLLKNLDRALKDGDQIYAVIDVSAVNNDGHTMGITTPNPEAQKDVIQEAFEKGKINPSSISYVETHGTGTMIGDPIELKALTRTFRERTQENQFCGVGSVKTNFGHLLSAAGIASFIKVVLSIQHKQLPPTLNCETPNPRFEFASSPFYPVTQLKDWNPREGIRRAGISSFGFGGSNAHIIISECDPKLLKQNHTKRHPLPMEIFSRKRYWIDRKYEADTSDRIDRQTVLQNKGKESQHDTSLLEFIDESSSLLDKSHYSLLEIIDESTISV